MKHIILTAALVLGAIAAHAQAVLEPAERTIQCAKSEVTCLAIAPKGDRVLVGTDKGAELRDILTGKRVAQFAFNEDGSTAVWHCAFNENGEFIVLIGFTGKREVWDVKDGKQDKMLASHKWIPDFVRVKALGLKNGNSSFDRFYQQSEAKRGSITAKADKDGTIIFTNAEGAAVQTLKYATNKDQHHRAPCLYTDDEFITGTDDGRVLFYKIAEK